MNPSYFARLVLLSSASFFLVQLLLAAVVAWIAPSAIRRSRVMRPDRAARLLLSLRLLPSAFAAFVVIALCVPSYLAFEPRAAEEEVGVACFIAALLGAAVLSTAAWRAIAALNRSHQYVERCEGQESRLGDDRVLIVPQSTGIALAGILHPRLLVSQHAITELSAEQLAVTLQHEHAHRISRDNLKRLLTLLSPAIFSRLKTLERAWIQCAEWAADDRAVQGDEKRSIALASALIQVARIQSGIAMPPLVTSLVDADEDLSIRVNRLLSPLALPTPRIPIESITFATVALLIVGMALNPDSLRMVHRLLELLLD